MTAIRSTKKANNLAEDAVCTVTVEGARNQQHSVMITDTTRGGGADRYDTPSPQDDPNSSLADIRSQLQFITSKMRADEMKKDEVGEWQFAAMVVDRLCFWFFTMFHIILTVAILTSPPSLH